MPMLTKHTRNRVDKPQHTCTQTNIARPTNICIGQTYLRCNKPWLYRNCPNKAPTPFCPTVWVTTAGTVSGSLEAAILPANASRSGCREHWLCEWGSDGGHGDSVSEVGDKEDV